MDDIEHLDHGLGQGSFWQGVLEGGPLDGIEYKFTGVPSHTGFRGLRFQVCLGPEPEASAWHVYHLGGERYVQGQGVVQVAVHLGTLDGDPEDWPPGSTPAD